MAKKRSVVTEEKPARYFIVNRAGAIHEVSKEHAQARLQQVGYRMATAEEVRKLMEQGGNQRFDQPICEPWGPEPQPIEGLEELDLAGLQLTLDDGKSDDGKSEN